MAMWDDSTMQSICLEINRRSHCSLMLVSVLHLHGDVQRFCGNMYSRKKGNKWLYDQRQIECEKRNLWFRLKEGGRWSIMQFDISTSCMVIGYSDLALTYARYINFWQFRRESAKYPNPWRNRTMITAFGGICVASATRNSRETCSGK